MNTRCCELARLISLACVGCASLAHAQSPTVVKSPETVPELVELSPFVVQTEPDRGYYSSQTMAGGRLRQEIKDTGSSIQVVTKQFMDDLGVTGVEELFQYTTGTEVGGIMGNYRMDADGSSSTQNTGTITDTNDIESRGFEAEITFNPTRNWRIACNLAKQETILTNIAPALTAQLNNVWLPHLAKYGNLDWNLPAEPVNGSTTAQQVNSPLLDYHVVKGQEGRAQAEQRKWRINLVSRYQVSEGKLKRFSVGGAARWQDRYADGYPLINDPRGVVVPDVLHPYYAEAEWSFDAILGYRLRILGHRDWRAQLNVRNLQNWTSDTVSVIRRQPDGTIARVRFDPPLQILLTNTFTF